jgi:hypothetical protein
MAELAQHADPSLRADEHLGPKELYRALCRVIDLEHSVIFTLDELLDVLELLDPKHRRAPGALRDDEARTSYRMLLATALVEADRILCWRVGEPRPAA